MTYAHARFTADALATAPALGAWCSIGSPLVAEGLATLGFDWINIDRQHSLIDDEATLAMIQMLDRGGTPAFVRIPEHGMTMISPVLDAGATGVIVPMVESSEDAERAVDAACYPPLGRRSWGPMRHAFRAESDPMPPNGLVMVMLETAAGIERAAEILAVPGVAGAFVGPADLAMSLGLGSSELAHPQVLERCETVVERCRERGLIAGTGAHSIGLAERWVRMGFQMVSLGRDVSLMREVAQARLEAIRAIATDRTT